jgi:hypothetical protein
MNVSFAAALTSAFAVSLGISKVGLLQHSDRLQEAVLKTHRTQPIGKDSNQPNRTAHPAFNRTKEQ